MEYNVGAINNIKVTTQIVTRVLYNQDLNTLYMCLHVDQLLLELSSWFAMVLGSAAITFHYSMRISILCTATSSELATHKCNLWMVVGVGAGQSIKEPGRITQYAATRELVLWFWSDYLFIFFNAQVIFPEGFSCVATCMFPLFAGKQLLLWSFVCTGEHELDTSHLESGDTRNRYVGVSQ
jgi:hypothetical protein